VLRKWHVSYSCASQLTDAGGIVQSFHVRFCHCTMVVADYSQRFQESSSARAVSFILFAHIMFGPSAYVRTICSASVCVSICLSLELSSYLTELATDLKVHSKMSILSSPIDRYKSPFKPSCLHTIWNLTHKSPLTTFLTERYPLLIHTRIPPERTMRRKAKTTKI
jgi:hypothetical protein